MTQVIRINMVMILFDAVAAVGIKVGFNCFLSDQVF